MSIASQAEVEAFTGRSPSHADWALIAILWPLAERLVKDYVGGPIEQTTHTEYYPDLTTNRGYDALPEDPEYDVVGGRAVAVGYGTNGDTLRLRNTPVRSITTIHDNPAAFQTAGGDWPASTLLSATADYLLDLNESGLSWTGLVYRLSGSWPVLPSLGRTVKVVYVAGFTAGELSGTTYSRFRTAALIAVMQWYNQVKAQQQSGPTGSAGAIVSESLDAWSVSFDAASASRNLGLMYQLPAAAMRILEGDVNLSRYLL